jgi:hypothetical protein
VDRPPSKQTKNKIVKQITVAQLLIIFKHNRQFTINTKDELLRGWRRGPVIFIKRRHANAADINTPACPRNCTTNEGPKYMSDAVY